MPEQLALFPSPQVEVSRDDYYTPEWVFQALGERFDLDVCAPPGGGPFVPCDKFYTMAEDGLASEWTGFVWMNPPFSKPLPWIEKFVRHGNGIALVPTSNGRWMDLLWEGSSGWLMLRRINFWTPNGPAKGSIPNRCWIVAAGDRALKALQTSNLGRVR